MYDDRPHHDRSDADPYDTASYNDWPYRDRSDPDAGDAERSDRDRSDDGPYSVSCEAEPCDAELSGEAAYDEGEGDEAQPMITFSEIDGTPVYYWRSGRPDSKTHNWRCTQAFYDRLVDWIRDLRAESSANGTISHLASAGFYVNKPGQHGAGTAMDLDHVQWSDGTVITPLDRHHASADAAVRRRYLAVDAICRRAFRYVLDGWYNAAHEDHIHADIQALPVRCNKRSKSDTKFVQAVCNNFGGAGLTVDGSWGPKTQATFDVAKAALGVTGDPHTNSAVWQSTLSAIARLGFADQSFPSTAVKSGGGS